MKKELIEKLLGKTKPIEEIFALYPARNLPQDAKVTRFAPSPTGNLHIGHLSQCLISERLAHLSDGVFYLRIEDTDQKREVEGSAKQIPLTLEKFDINFDEGTLQTEEGNYGPYHQSQRADIYKSFIAHLLENDLAYPAFETEIELEEQRKEQEVKKLRPGYYGEFAKSRFLTEEQIEKNLNENKSFVMRFKSQNTFEDKIKTTDLIRGDLEFPGYDLDVVILKNDGLPTYHLAHIIDDHLMGTTHVIRGEEWLSSLPLHLQMFKAFGFKAPKYGHISTIDTTDKETGNRRKLSKRKDPQANIMFYFEQGYPANSVIEYLLNIQNSNFEDWSKQNLEKNWKEFPFSARKLNNSGALFDFNKLNNISKEIISKMTADELYNNALLWAQDYNTEFYKKIANNKDYITAIFNIERNIGKASRKDIIKYSDIPNEISYFFDDEFTTPEINYDKELIKNVKEKFLSSFDINDSQEQWWKKIQDLSNDAGYTTDMKAYKENPSNFKGSIVDISNILRLLITGRTQSPNLYLIMQVMGQDRIKQRLK